MSTLAFGEDVRVLPASFSQERLWFLDQLVPDSCGFNVSAAWYLTGPLDVDVLERSLQRIIGRHETLRTTFRVVDGRPRQVIRQIIAASFHGA